MILFAKGKDYKYILSITKVFELIDNSLSKCKISYVIAAIYISPNQIKLRTTYISYRVLYTHDGAAFLGRGDDHIPSILGGDFNVHFAKDANLPLLHFLREKFGVDIVCFDRR